MASKGASLANNIDEEVAEHLPDLRTLAPPMPPGIRAMLFEDWCALDSEADRLLGWMRDERVFHAFAHGRAPFFRHLRGTWAMLAHWGQPQEVCRCGLLHSAYTRDGFYFRHFDILDPKSREDIRNVVGAAAEQLIYNYCSTDKMWDVSEYAPTQWRTREVSPWMVRLGEPLNPAGRSFPCRRDPNVVEHLTPEEIAKYLVVFVADIAEQLASTNTYMDVYHQEQPEILWPGECAPGIGYHILSRMLRTARPFLEVVPPIFNHCSEVISIEDEYEARALYWHAMSEMHEGGLFGMNAPASTLGESMPKEEQEKLYRRAAELNPYIAEPHIMLTQLLYNRSAFTEAAHEAVIALEILYQWGTCWDKRRSWAQWVGFSRMALMRATRRLKGLSSMPMQKLSEAADPEAMPVTYLKDLLASFEELTEKDNNGTESTLLKSRL